MSLNGQAFGWQSWSNRSAGSEFGISNRLGRFVGQASNDSYDTAGNQELGSRYRAIVGSYTRFDIAARLEQAENPYYPRPATSKEGQSAEDTSLAAKEALRELLRLNLRHMVLH